MAVQLQAHRGVSTDYPENTMRAFAGAVYQGYPIIELDPGVTKDGKIVILHDDTLNRTGRYPDGSLIEEPLYLRDLTYAELLSYDFGAWFSNKYRGEKIPLLADVLSFTKAHDVLVKIDNKFQKFSVEGKQALFQVVKESGARVAFTCYTMDAVELVRKEVPDAEIHYDGLVTEDTLKELAGKVPKDQLVIWLPFECPLTSWVKVPFADEALASMVKRYARLGLWILSDYEQRDEAIAKIDPDFIETTGGIKPIVRRDFRVDCHMHTEYSHDSESTIAKLCETAVEKGLSAICITDHSDFMGEDPITKILASVKAAREQDAIWKDRLRVFAGVEVAEGFVKPEVFERLKQQGGFDEIIGSIHLMGYFDPRRSCRKVDFDAMSDDEIKACMRQYFVDILASLKVVDCDVCAHLTYPLRYVVGNYKKHVELKDFEEEIKAIFAYLIEHGIALEVNTSCRDGGGSYDAFMPNEYLLRLYREMGGYLVTLGSDAHTPGRVSYAFPEACALLRDCGFKNVYYVENRYFCQCTLE